MKTTGDTIRIAMIGCGNRAVSWAKTIAAVKESKLVAICDRVAPRIQVVKKSAGDVSIREYTDHRRMLADGGFDAVAVVTEPEYQAVLSMEALDAGYHAISEVPVCYSLDECRRLVRTVERTRLTYYLAEQVRHAPLMRYWQWLVRQGKLGTVLFAEGHYIHAAAANRFWRNRDTGELLTWEQARNAPERVKTRLWTLPHPILYGPHELSPLLKVLDDHIISVSCYSTGTPSKRFKDVPWPGQFEEYPIPDIEVAMMQTAKGTIFRFACGSQPPVSEHHWYHLLGTKGEVETGRGKDEPGYSYFMPNPVLDTKSHRFPRTPEPWFSVVWSQPPPEVAAILDADVPEEAKQTGHGGSDYFPVANFVRSLLGHEKPDIDVYQAVETAVPVIVAAQSAKQNGARLEVPSLRP